jgi:hypothetical protein
VAVALYLYRQAQRSKRTCRLYIRGQRVDWKRIQTYVRKNKIDTESLAESCSCDVVPSYITFDFVDSVATSPVFSTPPTQPRPGSVTSSSHITLDSTPNESHTTTTASISQLTPELSPNNSSTATTSHRHDLANGTQNAAFDEANIAVPTAETNEKRPPVQWEHDQVGFLGRDELAGPTPEPSSRIVQNFVGHLINTTDPPVESDSLYDFYRLMSVTPPSASHLQRQSITPSHYPDGSLYPPDQMSNNTIGTEQTEPHWMDDGSHGHPEADPGCPAHFLAWSINACLRKNEGMDHRAELAMQVASESFKMMVASRHEKCLTTLNLLMALLEAHGKRDIALELLVKLGIAASSLKNIPERESVVLTIRFKMDIMFRLKIDKMFDPPILRHIHYRFERSWGADSPSTLACLCNLGWRLAGDKDAGRLTEALDVLSRARMSLERALEPNDPQTITCLTMLARVLYNLERRREGLEMMRTAMDRINMRFPDCHPYRLAALRRVSLFMQKVRSGDVETILREVASKRLRVLGPDCELTKGSMKELRDFLIERGRYDDVDDASRAVTEAASRLRCGETIFKLF